MKNIQVALLAAACAAPNEEPAAIKRRAMEYKAWLDENDYDRIMEVPNTMTRRPIRDNPQA